VRYRRSSQNQIKGIRGTPNPPVAGAEESAAHLDYAA
jgi:hypothetical protein